MGEVVGEWNGVVRFWWKTQEIVCKSPQPIELAKCVRLAPALKAYAVGDEGEIYEIGRSFFGKEKLGYRSGRQVARMLRRGCAHYSK